MSELPFEEPTAPVGRQAAATPSHSAAETGYTATEKAVLLFGLALMMVTANLVTLPLNVMVDPLRQSFAVDDLRVSLLLGMGFFGPYVLSSLVGGWLVDRMSRRRLLAIGAALWAAGGLICALAPSYPVALAGRILVGLGSGIKVPLAMTWLSDAFPAAQRGRAIGALYVVIGLGPSVAIPLAGTVLTLATDGGMGRVPMVAGLEPWRATLLVLLMPTLLLAPMLVALREKRRAHRAPKTPGMQTVRWIEVRHVVAIAFPIAAAVSLLTMGDNANLSWLVAVYIRSFGYDARSAGFVFGVVTLVAATVGPLVGGWLADRLQGEGKRDRRLWLSAAASLACSLLLLAYLAGNPLVLTVALAVAGVCSVGALATAIVVLQSMLPHDRRGLGTGFTTACVALLGSVGPTLVALVAQNAFSGPAATAQAVAVTCSSLVMLAAIVFAAIAYRRAP